MKFWKLICLTVNQKPQFPEGLITFGICSRKVKMTTQEYHAKYDDYMVDKKEEAEKVAMEINKEGVDGEKVRVVPLGDVWTLLTESEYQKAVGNEQI